MQPNGFHKDPPGREHYNRNRTSHPPEMLWPYINQYIAWQGDGMCILASGKDPYEVEAKLVAMGIDPSQVVFEFVPDPDISYL